jgi:hypothetical protein
MGSEIVTVKSLHKLAKSVLLMVFSNLFNGVLMARSAEVKGIQLFHPHISPTEKRQGGGH